MTRPRTSGRRISACAAACLALIQPALADPPSPQSSAAAAAVPRPEALVLQALRANPVTARIGSRPPGNQPGRPVGDSRHAQIHDTAVRIAIASGYSVRDDLRIDTAETYRVAAAAAAAAGQPAYPPQGLGSYYVYPPPLFGRLDNPFFGFEPPLVELSPLVARGDGPRPDHPAQRRGPRDRRPLVRRGPTPTRRGSPGQLAAGRLHRDDARSPGRGGPAGMVPSLADRVTIGQRIAQLPGVSQVTNLLEVGRPVSETPPPPPQPDPPRAAAPPAAPNPARGADARAPRPAVAVNRDEPGPSPQPGIREPARTERAADRAHSPRRRRLSLGQGPHRL